VRHRPFPHSSTADQPIDNFSILTLKAPNHWTMVFVKLEGILLGIDNQVSTKDEGGDHRGWFSSALL
jgi:hypothetical protein